MDQVQDYVFIGLVSLNHEKATTRTNPATPFSVMFQGYLATTSGRFAKTHLTRCKNVYAWGLMACHAVCTGAQEELIPNCSLLFTGSSMTGAVSHLTLQSVEQYLFQNKGSGPCPMLCDSGIVLRYEATWQWLLLQGHTI